MSRLPANGDTLERLQNKLLQGAEGRHGTKPRSTATVFSHIRSLYTALNWAKKKKWLSEVPWIDLVQVDQTRKGRPLAGEQVDRILAAPSHRRVAGAPCGVEQPRAALPRRL